MEQQVHAPTPGELPTRRQLNRATLVAAGVASVLLITAVLPAEYGYDPTGAGTLLGLTPMGEMKRDQASSGGGAADVDDSGDLVLDEPAQPVSSISDQTGEVTLTLAPGEGTEVKATMEAGGQLRYEWATGGPKVNFELHGEEIGAEDYTSYEKGTSAGESGTFRAPFAGTHGWYWRNRTSAPLTVRVKATGSFAKFEQLK